MTTKFKEQTPLFLPNKQIIEINKYGRMQLITRTLSTFFQLLKGQTVLKIPCKNICVNVDQTAAPPV